MIRSDGTHYITTFCNFPHRLFDGKPMEHNCFILDPRKLQMEADGTFDFQSSIVKEPRREMTKGVKYL